MTDVRKISKDVSEADLEITFNNVKAEAVEVKFEQNFSNSWEILSESLQSAKKNADTAVWTLQLPADAKTVLKFKHFVIVGLLSFWPGTVFSGPADYVGAFDVDLQQKLPPFSELQKKYAAEAEDYDKGYDYGWNIGTVFNEVFKNTITGYGKREARIAPKNEEAILNMLAALPEQYYQYIGPYLHQVPGMSEKVLNLPGIKETKNKFPTRLAPQVKDIKNLEFLSPAFYFLLMPDAWPYNIDLKEYPLPEPVKAKAKHNPRFFETVEKIVPMKDFGPDAPAEKKLGRSDLRTPNPSKTSLLTAADVKAFINTLDKVNAFGNQQR